MSVSSSVTTASMPTKATILIDTNRQISPISPLLFSGFMEHMGRSIYQGLYDPGSPHADSNGLRTDVIAELRQLNFRAIRYPGGNFLSGYRWEDGVGPRDHRPVRRDLAWQSIETNQFGTNEFIEVCHMIQAEPMIGVNMGTGSIQDAANLVEYCNAPVGTQYADLRASHGYPEPHNVKYWCLGNEMDGPWQIGYLEAAAYGAKTREAAKLMHWQDPTAQLILCGSSHSSMPSYPSWDRIALEYAWEHVNYHSLHYYASNIEEDTASYLAVSAELESFVETLEGVLRYVKAHQRSKHDVYLSWDEWNVWYRARHGDAVHGHWQKAPHLLEETYNLEDALVVAQWLNVFLRKSNILRIACLAQAVNVIAPIVTTRDTLLKQSIYYPFVLFSKLAAGVALDVLVKAPLYTTTQFGDMPLLDVSASYDEANQAGAVFIVNRSLTDALVVDLHWQDKVPQQLVAAWQMAGSDPKAANDLDHPDQVRSVQIATPRIDNQTLTLNLPSLSFTALELKM